jgi:hypothetical protein
LAIAAAFFSPAGFAFAPGLSVAGCCAFGFRFGGLGGLGVGLAALRILHRPSARGHAWFASCPTMERAAAISFIASDCSREQDECAEGEHYLSCSME